MRIRIDEPWNDRSRLVTFTSDAGRATAVWHGDAPPTPGQYDVELDIPATLRWGRDVHAAGNVSSGLSVTAGGHRVTGRVVDYDPEDGVLSLQVAGAILIVDTDGPAPAEIVGETVDLHTQALGIYPTNI